MSIFQRWLQISTEMACIGAAVLLVWSIPLLYERGISALLPSGALLTLTWLLLTAIGCVAIWLRSRRAHLSLGAWVSRASLPQPGPSIQGEAIS